MSDPISRLNAALEDRYHVERELGEGGMANVFLAKDLKHNRHVALKVLKQELAAVVGAERFLAEIETTAKLQHPHILPLFDSGEAQGFLYYVMPYVKGDTLRDWIDRDKQLPVDEATRVTTAMANALDYAHRHGVIHRDIKPANILIQDGEPVVADFGIALAVGAAGGSRLTETGLSVGTPFYMSPEQATGDQQVGPQSDIYALAAVLYETLTGEPPYTGTTAQAVLGRIIQGAPVSATEIRAAVPANVDAAVRKALEKLPADRFKSAGEFARALADPGFRHGEVAGGVLGASTSPAWKRAAWGFGVVAAGLAGALGWMLTRPEPTRQIERFSVPFEPTEAPTAIGSNAFALSPDGTQLVYWLQEPSSGFSRLMIRRWDALEAVPIRESGGARDASVSPDGLELAFVQGPDVKVLSLAGGPIRTLGTGSAPEWGPDGSVFVSTNSGIVRFPSGGGAEPVTSLEPGETLHILTDVLPDERFALVAVHDGDQSAEIRRLDLVSLEMTPITSGLWPRYAGSGHLVFLDQNSLMAAPFDVSTAELGAPPVPVLEEVAAYSISDDGKLFYSRLIQDLQQLQLMWVTRDGVATPVDPTWTFDPSPANGNRSWVLSPDGTRIAFKKLTDLGPDIWIKTLPDGPESRFTMYDGEDRLPRWTPDGEALTFLSDRNGNLDVWSRSADRTGEATLVLDVEANLAEAVWSPDGSWLVIRTGGAGGLAGGRDIYALRPGTDTEPAPLVVTDYDEGGVALSPDGRWMAYQSDETGRREVFVRPFPNVDDGIWQVSINSGRGAVWANNGREIFYLSDQNDVMVAEFETEPNFTVTRRQTLFTVGPEYYFMNNTTTWGVTPDDQAFLMARTAAGQEDLRPFVLVNNFFEELKVRVRR